MENVQRAVMLLKPDAHVMGQWDSGATLKLQTAPGGIVLSLRIDGRIGGGGVLTLFLRNDIPYAVGEVKGPSMQARAEGIRLADVAGAALIQDNRFVLKSPLPDWPAIIAQYRFAQKQVAAPREGIGPQAPEHTTETQTEEAVPIEMGTLQEAEVIPPLEEQPLPLQENVSPMQMNMPLEDIMPERDPESNPEPTATADVGDYPLQRMPYREPDEECPGGVRQYHVDPFPGEFPGSEWVKISYPGPAGWWHYIFGRTRVEDVDADVIGVPGEYSMAPPVWLDGFSTWVRCTSGDARGYWLMFQDAQTGRVLDISRSRRGG